MLLSNVVDQFHDDDGLADPGATKQSDFAAFQEGLDQVNDLYSGFEHLGSRGLLVEWRGRPVDGHGLLVSDRTELVHWLANHVHYPPQRAPSHGNRNRPAEVDGFHTAHHAVGRLHGNATHPAFAQVLLHLENDIDRRGHLVAVADHLERLINRRHLGFHELRVDHRAGNLNNVANIFWHKTSALMG